MFRNRQSSQKPPDELFERFRQSFPGVRAGSTSGPSESHLQTAGGLHDSTLNQPRQVPCRILEARVLVSLLLCTSSDGDSMLHIVWEGVGGGSSFSCPLYQLVSFFFFLRGKSSHNLRKGIEMKLSGHPADDPFCLDCY
ncbi:hypothetical protein B9Z19DRAFT_312094 [Tuber borchii]|uniref:Uncharacterized protein n=1 Tax=Tuber borchii TaxID=42251 RepID=A0A2T6ZJW5_TUBBO|nr:hypothetical protein B9Z19DRAFT_312094 [Tuber borchii]